MSHHVSAVVGVWACKISWCVFIIGEQLRLLWLPIVVFVLCRPRINCIPFETENCILMNTSFTVLFLYWWWSFNGCWWDLNRVNIFIIEVIFIVFKLLMVYKVRSWNSFLVPRKEDSAFSISESSCGWLLAFLKNKLKCWPWYKKMQLNIHYYFKSYGVNNS